MTNYNSTGRVVTNVYGLGSSIPVNNVEYTSATVVEQYTQYMAALQLVLTDTTNNASDYSTLMKAIQNIVNLANKGATGDSILSGTYYMTSEMSSNAGLVISTLSASGISLSNPLTNASDQANAVLTWQGLASIGVQKILSNAINSTLDASRSLQSMIELEYIQQGNTYINNNLTSLQAQLSTTQLIINNLTVVQNVINEITVSPAGNFAFPPANDSELPSTVVTALSSLNLSSHQTTLLAVNLTNILSYTPLAINAINSILSSPANNFMKSLVSYASGTPDSTFQSALSTLQTDDPSAYTAFENAVQNPSSTYTNDLIPSNQSYILFQALPSAQQTAAANAILKDYASLSNASGSIFIFGGIGLSFANTYANEVSLAAAYVKANPTVSFQSALAMQTGASSIIASYANGNAQQFVTSYQMVASAQFTQVFPTATPQATTPSSLLAAYYALKSETASLESQTGESASTQNSLAYFIQQVTNNISSFMMNLNTTGLTPAQVTDLYLSAAKAYIIDNQNQKLSTTSGFQAGSVQTNVTNAVTAAQSLNTQQQINVNNYEFVFQQFYTSASNILSNLTQIIQSEAQAIAKQ